MNIENIIAFLLSITRLLTISEVAEIFGVHESSIERWIRKNHFPNGYRMKRFPKRLWRPDELLAWTQERKEAEAQHLNVEQVCARVGVHPQTWQQWVKDGDAPPPDTRELGTGRHLWPVAVIDAWMQENTPGGFALPNEYQAITEGAAKRRGPKRRVA